MKALVATQDDGLRSLFATYLQQEGYEVAESATGLGALRIACGAKFTAAVVDDQLGDVTGIRCIKPLKEACPGIRVILVSSDDTLKQAAKEAGADCFLALPVFRDDFWGALSVISAKAKQPAA